MLVTVPDMLTALAATVLLVVVAITSVRFALRRDRLRAVAPGAPHGVRGGGPVHPPPAVHRLRPEPLTRASHLLVDAVRRWWREASVWWRVLVPVVRSTRHRIRVEAVVEEAPGVWSVWLRGRRLRPAATHAPDSSSLAVQRPRPADVAHPWSLSRMPEDNRLRLTVRDLGDHSRAVANLRRGTRVLIEGPYGAFTDRAPHPAQGPARGGRHRRHPDPRPGRGAGTGSGHPPGRRHGRLPRERRRGAGTARRARSSLAAGTDGRQLHLLVGPPVRGSSLRRAATPGRDDADRLRRPGAPTCARHDVYVCGPPVWMQLVRRTSRRPASRDSRSTTSGSAGEGSHRPRHHRGRRRRPHGELAGRATRGNRQPRRHTRPVRLRRARSWRTRSRRARCWLAQGPRCETRLPHSATGCEAARRDLGSATGTPQRRRSPRPDPVRDRTSAGVAHGPPDHKHDGGPPHRQLVDVGRHGQRRARPAPGGVEGAVGPHIDVVGVVPPTPATATRTSLQAALDAAFA